MSGRGSFSRSPRRWRFLAVFFGITAVFPALAEGAAHTDPITPVALALALVMLVAKLGGDLSARLKQPPVLGELLVGMVLGNLPLLGFTGLDFIRNDPMVDMLARLGVLILLFEVGLESTVGQMMKVGFASTLVAVAGVVAPMLLGLGVGELLLPKESFYAHLFLGAVLCATSVGITARVMQDMGQSQSREARIVLGAAVIDDVLGLVVLAVVAGVIGAVGHGGGFPVAETGVILAKATVFLVGSLALGVWLSPKLFTYASRLQTRGVLLATGLGFCFFLSWLAGVVGLAPIVGAFAAGLILEDLHYQSFQEKEAHTLDELVMPLSHFLVPVFFVLMGWRVDLRAFVDPTVLGVALAITLAAIVGKQVCGLVVPGRGLNRLAIGVGMIPRGEVGLIFANMGLHLKIQGEPVVSAGLFSAIVVMVILTTVVTPPALGWAFARKPKSAMG